MDDAEGGTGDPLSADDKDIIKHYEEGLQKILDLIAPAAVEVRSNEMILNDQHSRTLYVYNWPNYIYPNWLSPLVNFDAQMEIAHFIYPSSNKAIMKMLRKKVVELRSSIRLLEQRGIVRDPTLEAALQDAEELRDLLARGREKLFQFGMYITLYAEDEEKLKKLQTDIESLLGGRLVLTKPALFQMEHAWNSTLPLCLDELEISRNMNTSPIGTSFPFSSCDLTDDHGILYGINRHNDSLVIFDRFDLPNANANVFATSGAGKSFTVKLEILRSLMLGTEVLVIDPENEYVELCKTVGGSFIPMSLQSDFRINPFDLPEAVRGEEAEVGEVLRTSVLNLHGLFKLMLGALTPAEDGILDKAILDTYALRGITITTEKPGTIDPPTMHDLVDVLLTTDGGENMARVLQKYTEGSYAGLFNRATNVELQKQMIVFQIRDLEDQLRPIAIYIILNFLWNRVRTELKKRFLVIDEAWNLMQYDDSARFLFGIVKRARKYYLGITTITQDVDDFVNSPYGKPIITNSALQILLKQSPTAVDNLQKLFYLTDGEKYVLLNSGVGQGIFFAGNKHVAIQIIASPVETTIVTTKPEEVLARMQSTGGKLAAEQTTDIPLSQFDGTVPKTSMQMLKQSEEILVAKTERDMAKSEKNDGGQDAQSSAPIPANAEESGNSAPAEGVSIPSRSIDQENPPPALSDDSSSITTSSEVPETTDENVIASTSLDDLLKQTTPKPPEIAADGIADNGSTAEAITDILPSPEDTPDVPPDLPDVTPQPATPRGGRILPPERKK
ncbi:ATP-binding protein [Candidatus Peregrinibacteria bacterium]|nr:ATP-binding protein [Candidatus Peregrinibacteria bacterium]